MRKTPIAALVAAEIISILGSRMTYLALPWFVLVTTGSPSKMTLVLAAEIAPMAILGIPSGIVVERLGARTTMLTCDAARIPLLEDACVAEVRGQARVRLLPDRARVEDEHVGVPLRGGLAQAKLFEQPLDPLRVVSVHLTPERADVVAAHRALA